MNNTIYWDPAVKVHSIPTRTVAAYIVAVLERLGCTAAEVSKIIAILKSTTLRTTIVHKAMAALARECIFFHSHNLKALPQVTVTLVTATCFLPLYSGQRSPTNGPTLPNRMSVLTSSANPTVLLIPFTVSVWVPGPGPADVVLSSPRCRHRAFRRRRGCHCQ